MKRQIISIILILVMTFSPAALALDDQATSGSCGENLTWTLSADGTLIISGDGAMDDYGSDYSSRSPWYSCNYKIKKIEFNGNPTNIGNYAFQQCDNLIDVTIPDSVTSIGESAFCYCSALTNVIIPGGVTNIEKSVFWGCSSLTDIIIPNSVINIEKYAFTSCDALTNVTIPDGVRFIEDDAFNGCKSLRSIDIPASVIRLGTIDTCMNLNEINVSSFNKVYSSFNGVLFDKEGGTLIRCPRGKTSFEIPDNVIKIGDGAFKNCTYLDDITIPDSVTSIGRYAFYECTSLQKVVLSNFLLQSSLEYCFEGCTELVSIEIPEGVTKLTHTFSGCSKLASISLPLSLKRIDSATFNGCFNLKTITYAGTKDQWANIEIESNNQELALAELVCAGDDPNQPTEPEKAPVLKYTRSANLSYRDKRTYFGGKLEIKNPNTEEKTYYISIGDSNLKVNGKDLSITYVETLGKNESYSIPCQRVFQVKIYEIPKDQDLSVGFDLGNPVVSWTPVFFATPKCRKLQSKNVGCCNYKM